MDDVKDIDLETLDSYLDEALGEEEVALVCHRLEREPALSKALEALRDQRDVRMAYFESLDDEAAAARLSRNVIREARRQDVRALVWGLARPVAAAAACLVLFVAGWNGRSWFGGRSGGAQQAKGTVYQVVLTDERGVPARDEEGRPLAQSFATREEADAFAAELRRWQEVHRQVQSGQAVPVMAYH